VAGLATTDEDFPYASCSIMVQPIDAILFENLTFVDGRPQQNQSRE
jgi:hypothetical protein